MILNKKSVDVATNEFLKSYYTKYFTLQKLFKNNVMEIYSIFDLKFALKHKIYNNNLLYHILAVDTVYFNQERKVINDLYQAIELIKTILTCEMSRDVYVAEEDKEAEKEKKKQPFTENDIKETIKILRRLEKKYKKEMEGATK